MIQFNNVESDALATLMAAQIAGPQEKFIRVELSDTEVQALNSSPITLVAAPGTGYAIKVVNASGACDGAAAYSANMRLQLYTNQTLTQFQSDVNFLDDGSSYTHQLFSQVAPVAQTSQIDENAPLKVWAPVGNPSGGSSAVTLYVTYQIIEL